MESYESKKEEDFESDYETYSENNYGEADSDEFWFRNALCNIINEKLKVCNEQLNLDDRLVIRDVLLTARDELLDVKNSLTKSAKLIPERFPIGAAFYTLCHFKTQIDKLKLKEIDEDLTKIIKILKITLIIAFKMDVDYSLHTKDFLLLFNNESDFPITYLTLPKEIDKSRLEDVEDKLYHSLFPQAYKAYLSYVKYMVNLRKLEFEHIVALDSNLYFSNLFFSKKQISILELIKKYCPLNDVRALRTELISSHYQKTEKYEYLPRIDLIISILEKQSVREQDQSSESVKRRNTF